MRSKKMTLKIIVIIYVHIFFSGPGVVIDQWHTGGGGDWAGSNHPKIPKAFQNRAKLNPTVKTVKNCWI